MGTTPLIGCRPSGRSLTLNFLIYYISHKLSLFSLRKTFRPLIKNTDDASLFFLYSVQLLNYSQLEYVAISPLRFKPVFTTLPIWVHNFHSDSYTGEGHLYSLFWFVLDLSLLSVPLTLASQGLPHSRSDRATFTEQDAKPVEQLV